MCSSEHCACTCIRAKHIIFAHTPKVDHALCTILDKLQPQNINGYHEHDSLLEHIFDEELTEEEKKTAWDTYKQQTAVEAQK